MVDDPALRRYDCIVECDASWHEGSAGLGYRILRSEGRKSRGRSVARKAVGPQHAEALCVAAALRDAAARVGDGKRALVRCDSRWLVGVLRGRTTVAKPYMVNAVRAIKAVEAHFATVYYQWVRSKAIKQSDRAALRGRKRSQDRDALRVAQRSAKVRAAYLRGSTHEVHANEDGTFSVRRIDRHVWFTVDLDGLTCGCYYFVQRWGGKDTATRAKNMTPCSHMAAAAERAGRTDMPWNRYL